MIAGAVLAVVGLLGPPREVSSSASASRDTPALGMVIAPHRVLSGGGELGIVSIAGDDLTLRLGFYGMVELESSGTLDRLLPYPTADIRYWRGLIGYTAALSLDGAARALLGEGSALEAEVGYHHESEHQTASNSGGPSEDVSDVPQVGDAIHLDVAARLRRGDVDVSVRLRERLFIPGKSSYAHAPGVDVEARWRALAHLHPFASAFAENMFGAYRYPDVFLVRGLVGAVVSPGVSEVYLYLFADVGHRKGLAALTKEENFGVGIRVAFY
ncbi:MAG TPA: hypothetical protein VKE22_09970 [Haliangiales bacterium]|nr:hypothetical protein [Haliangiales bacterium]